MGMGTLNNSIYTHARRTHKRNPKHAPQESFVGPNVPLCDIGAYLTCGLWSACHFPSVSFKIRRKSNTFTSIWILVAEK